MTTHHASIFVELEIKVSGTLVPSDPPTHEPPYPGSDGGWEDLTVEGIVSHKPRMLAGQICSRRRELFTSALVDTLTDEFREEIEIRLTAEVPDGPDPDDARDRAIDARLMGDD